MCLWVAWLAEVGAAGPGWLSRLFCLRWAGQHAKAPELSSRDHLWVWGASCEGPICLPHFPGLHLLHCTSDGGAWNFIFERPIHNGKLRFMHHLASDLKSGVQNIRGQNPLKYSSVWRRWPVNLLNWFWLITNLFLRTRKGGDCSKDECALRILSKEDMGPELISSWIWKYSPHNPACDSCFILCFFCTHPMKDSSLVLLPTENSYLELRRK